MGSADFIETIKSGLGYKSVRRKIVQGRDFFELREDQQAYYDQGKKFENTLSYFEPN